MENATEDTTVIVLIVAAVLVVGFIFWLRKQAKSKRTGIAKNGGDAGLKLAAWFAALRKSADTSSDTESPATKSTVTKSGSSKGKKTKKRK